MATPVISPQAARPGATPDISRAPARNSGWVTSRRRRGSGEESALGFTTLRPPPAARRRWRPRQRETPQEIGCRQALAAGALQLGDAQHTVAARHPHAIGICRQNLTIPSVGWSFQLSMWERQSLTVSPSSTLLAPGKGSNARMRRSIVRGRLRPVDGAFGLFDLVRVGHALCRLPDGLQAPGGGLVQGQHHQLAPQIGQPVVQRGRWCRDR